MFPIIAAALAGLSIAGAEFTKRRARRRAAPPPAPPASALADSSKAAAPALAAAVAPPQAQLRTVAAESRMTPEAARPFLGALTPPADVVTFIKPAVQPGRVVFAVEDQTPDTIFRAALPFA